MPKHSQQRPGRHFQRHNIYRTEHYKQPYNQLSDAGESRDPGAFIPQMKPERTRDFPSSWAGTGTAARVSSVTGTARGPGAQEQLAGLCELN